MIALCIIYIFNSPKYVLFELRGQYLLKFNFFLCQETDIGVEPVGLNALTCSIQVENQ